MTRGFVAVPAWTRFRTRCGQTNVRNEDHRTGAYTQVREDPRTAVTQQASAAVRVMEGVY
ncbi:MAG: hypothetical protein M3O22_07665 [Pseudomonadota bacterium]|nr:hypothetical protein [Pseudomonadota bacterium]